MLHRDPLPAEPPVHPWYTEPVPAPVWPELAERPARAEAPFAAEFAASVPHVLDLQNLFATRGRCSGAIATCGPTTCAGRPRAASE